jgi:hypothetical protein
VWVKKNLHQGGAIPSGLFFYSQIGWVKQQGRWEKETMEKSKKDVFVAIVVLLIVISFLALMIAHIYAILHGNYEQTAALQETSFIAALTLGLAIVLLIPYMITEKQIKKEIDTYWNDHYKNTMDQFISKSQKDYAHTSRVIAYLLKQKEHYYWAMTWASDSVVAYIRRFKEYPTDFQLNKEYFNFSLNIMKKSFEERKNGSFLRENESLDKKDIIDKFKNKMNIMSGGKKWDAIINNKIFEGDIITSEEMEINAVKELKWVILRYIKWQCIIYIEKQEHEKLSDDVIDLIETYLDSDFEKEFKGMVERTLKSFYDVNKKQFIKDVVKKVELEEEKEKVREYLKKIVKSTVI